MMQTADARRRLQFRAIWFRLHGPPGWCVLFKPEMSPVLMVVSDELAAQPPDVRFIERYHMIEALSACATNPSFRDAILPGTPDARSHRVNGGRLE